LTQRRTRTARPSTQQRDRGTVIYDNTPTPTGVEGII